jgi:hypothetical protein
MYEVGPRLLDGGRRAVCCGAWTLVQLAAGLTAPTGGGGPVLLVHTMQLAWGLQYNC